MDIHDDLCPLSPYPQSCPQITTLMKYRKSSEKCRVVGRMRSLHTQLLEQRNGSCKNVGRKNNFSKNHRRHYRDRSRMIEKIVRRIFAENLQHISALDAKDASVLGFHTCKGSIGVSHLIRSSSFLRVSSSLGGVLFLPLHMLIQS